MKYIKYVWELLEGKKTYCVAIAAIIWGWYSGDSEAVLFGLGIFGLRQGISTEISKLITRKK